MKTANPETSEEQALQVRRPLEAGCSLGHARPTAAPDSCPTNLRPRVTRPSPSRSPLLVLLLALSLSLAAAPSTNGPAAAVAGLPAATPAAPAVAAQEQPLARSEFDPKLANSRDPFFPRSTRRVVVSTTPTKRPVADTSQLALKGISGTAGRRLALINDLTFEQGQEDAVRTAAGRLRIVCEEIRQDSVIVSFGDPPQRVELRLPRSF